jgi:8-oxo-dGTP diphosphatase
MTDKNLRPRVGITAAIVKDGKILVGLRRDRLSQATVFALPGGHVEYGETLEQTVRREIFEETGIRAKNFEPGCVSTDIWPQKQVHYVNFIMIADYESGMPVCKEPEVFESWSWMEWRDIVAQKSRCGVPLGNAIEIGFNPFIRGKVVCR